MVRGLRRYAAEQLKTMVASIARRIPAHVARRAPPRDAERELRVAGIAISNAERPIAEAPGHTKLDIVRYYERVAPWLLPQIAPRPVAVLKCNEGRFDDCFFQRHPLRERGETVVDDSPPFLRLADTADIVRAAQNGAYEFHTWGASFPRLERPDRITLDLDPDPALPWSALGEATSHVRALLDRLELRGFVKTSGG
jgi:bifunctional non-homologous end joining protein LigD